MNPRKNPYAPGAGTSPPMLAGRGKIIEKCAIALERIRAGLSARSFLLIGLRGVGKTVLLNRVQQDAEAQGMHVVFVEAPERRSLPALLAPKLRAELIALDRGHAASALTKRALRALGGFVSAMKLKFSDIEFGVDLGHEEGVADSGDLDADLTSLLVVVGEAAREKKTALVLLIDELQYVEERQLEALITALHKCAQLALPLTLVGAGLPQLVGQMGSAKSYAERLFEFPLVGPLAFDDASQALVAPARHVGVEFEAAALTEIFRHTAGYPYFLQEWGKHAWDVAQSSPITAADVETASAIALAELDASFFRVRFDRVTPSEKRYLRAMAEIGPGPYRSGDVAEKLGRAVNQVAPVRASLIRKGMVYSPEHGDVAFTVPLFDAYMRRKMPF